MQPLTRPSPESEAAMYTGTAIHRLLKDLPRTSLTLGQVAYGTCFSGIAVGSYS